MDNATAMTRARDDNLHVTELASFLNDLLAFVSSHEMGCVVLLVLVIALILVLFCTPTSQLAAIKSCLYKFLVDLCQQARRNSWGSRQSRGSQDREAPSN